MRQKIQVIITSILAAVCLLSLSACATCRKGGPRLTIINASYGVADHRVDVTGAVRTLVAGNAICLRAPWALGEVDPAFGTLKDVQITYRLGGPQQTAAFTQQQDIMLPDSPAALAVAGEDAANTAALKKAADRALAGAPGYEFHTWHQGQPPLRLIREEDGFCALTLVTGHFQGGGEVARVYIGKDGYWYLGGHSMQKGVAAQCIVVHYR